MDREGSLDNIYKGYIAAQYILSKQSTFNFILHKKIRLRLISPGKQPRFTKTGSSHMF